MAKELPYFKFEPSEWKFSIVQKLSKESKLTFIDLLCSYWHRNCEMPVKIAKVEFDEKIISELIEYNVVKLKDDNIVINFLDRQFLEILEKSNKNSEAGRASAIAKQKKKLSKS